MVRLPDLSTAALVSSRITLILIGSSLKGLVIYGLVHLFVGKNRRLSAAHRHFFWFFAVVSCLLIPLLSLVAPPVRLPDIPLPSARGKAVSALVAEFVPSGRPVPFPAEFPSFTALSSPFPAEEGTSPRARMGPGMLGERPSPTVKVTWTNAAVAVWLVGAFLLLSQILAEQIRLAKFISDAHPSGERPFTRLFDDVTGRKGFRRSTRVLVSARCRVPFACGVFRPVILFPAASRRWPLDRLRAVYTHELAHVNRMDYLTRLLSRSICSLFWFCPHLWLAHGKLHVEQERAADAFAVGAGTRPSDYARYLLDLARVLKRPDPLLAGLFALGNRKSTLERRVVDILRMRGGRDAANALPLFSPRFLRPFAICLLCALPFLCFNPTFKSVHRAPAAFAVGSKVEGGVEVAGMRIEPAEALARIAGTWVKEAYNGVCEPFCFSKKFVVHTDGSVELWHGIDDYGPHTVGFYEIGRSWFGQDGCLYCQARRKRASDSACVTTELWRIDPLAMILELILVNGTQEEFPDRIDPALATAGHVSYLFYRRADAGSPADGI